MTTDSDLRARAETLWVLTMMGVLVSKQTHDAALHKLCREVFIQGYLAGAKDKALKELA